MCFQPLSLKREYHINERIRSNIRKANTAITQLNCSGNAGETSFISIQASCEVRNDLRGQIAQIVNA